MLSLLATGCGGGKAAPPQAVTGAGFGFSAPAGWEISKSTGRVQAAAAGGSPALVAVSRFALLKRFRPELWPKVVDELDRAARGIADQQQGRVTGSRTTTIGGRRARQYDVEYERDGNRLVERIGFLLQGKTEFLLLCRYERGGGEAHCRLLLTSFRLT